MNTRDYVVEYIRKNQDLLVNEDFNNFLDTTKMLEFAEDVGCDFTPFKLNLIHVLDTSNINYLAEMDRIPSNLFAGDTNLISIIIPSNIKSIRNKAFKECLYLKSITIEEGLEGIGLKAFNFCESLTSVKLPESLNRLGEMAFARCRNLKNITLPKSHPVYLPDEVFLGTGISDIEIPDNVEFIDHRAFAECKNLTRLSIGDSTAGEGDIFLQSNSIQAINYRGTWESLKRNTLFKKFVRNDLPSGAEISCTDRKLTFTQFLAATGKIS